MQSGNSRSWMTLQAQGKRGEDMLELSFSSCVSTLLFETAAIGLLAVFSGKIRTISERSARFVTGMLWTVILRLLFPVEFLYIQSDVCLARPWTEVYQKVTGEVGELGGQRYSLLGVGVIVSVSVSAVLALRLSVNLFRLRRMTRIMGGVMFTGEISAELRRYCEEALPGAEGLLDALERIGRETEAEPRPDRLKFRLAIPDSAGTPFLTGFFHRTMILPPLRLSGEEWYGVLRHELAHARHGDLWLRLACELVRILYWWNPAAYLLARTVSRVQELRADAEACRGMTQTQRLSYAQCLLDLARNSCALQGQWILPFGRRTELPVRVRALLYPAKGEDRKGSSGFKKCAFVVLLLFFGLFLPNFTVVKPYEPLPAQVMQIAQENGISGGYYVTSENGSYNIHVDGGLFRLNRENRMTCKTAAPRRLNNLFHCHIKTGNPGNVFLKNRKYNDTLNK